MEHNKYKPIGPWKYCGYTLLFLIPFVGLSLLIIFSIDSENINRKNFARSFFCGLIILLGIAIIAGAIYLGYYLSTN